MNQKSSVAQTPNSVRWVLTSDIRQAVASNADRMIVDRNLARFGLARAGLVTVTRNDVVNGKPDPEMYNRALYLLGLAPNEAVVLEDSPTGAKAGILAGMKTYLVASNKSGDVADVAQVPDLELVRQQLSL